MTACGFCAKSAAWLVIRDVPGSPESTACGQHAGLAMTRLLEATGAGSVTVRPLSGGKAIGDGGVAFASLADVTEQVRRIGAHSAAMAAPQMEYDLYRAVLVMIAQGAPLPSALAATALQTQNYGFERFRP